MTFRKRSPSTKVQSHRPLRAFLCHASGDKPAVRKLYRQLQADGVEPWLDEKNLLPGQDWQREIRKAVRESDVVIVCLSRRSATKTGYVQKEITYALDVADLQPEGTIFIIPAKLEECDVPDRLRHLHWINLFEKPGYSLLLQTLQMLAARLEVIQDQHTSIQTIKLPPTDDELEAQPPQAEPQVQAPQSEQNVTDQDSRASTTTPQSRWSWNDHPIVVTIMVLAALVAIIAYVTGKPNLPDLISNLSSQPSTSISPTAPTLTPTATLTAEQRATTLARLRELAGLTPAPTMTPTPTLTDQQAAANLDDLLVPAVLVLLFVGTMVWLLRRNKN